MKAPQMNSRLSQRLNKLISITDEIARLQRHLTNLDNNIQHYDRMYGPEDVTINSSIMHPLLQIQDVAQVTSTKLNNLATKINRTLEE
tara:strand:+ start:54 stop:317 length:264 start_codon:yes stop_codon:yes gene_type:complete